MCTTKNTLKHILQLTEAVSCWSLASSPGSHILSRSSNWNLEKKANWTHLEYDKKKKIPIGKDKTKQQKTVCINKNRNSRSAEVERQNMCQVYLCGRGAELHRRVTQRCQTGLRGLWHAFKWAAATKRPIEPKLPPPPPPPSTPRPPPRSFAPSNPWGTWLLDPAKSAESQETASAVTKRRFLPRT